MYQSIWHTEHTHTDQTHNLYHPSPQSFKSPALPSLLTSFTISIHCLVSLAQSGEHLLLNWKVLGSNAGQVHWLAHAILLHVNFVFWNLHIQWIMTMLFCLKIVWAIVKLWWFKVWSVESLFIHSRQTNQTITLKCVHQRCDKLIVYLTQSNSLFIKNNINFFSQFWTLDVVFSATATHALRRGSGTVGPINLV